jgi:signal transduction histidine kinase
MNPARYSRLIRPIALLSIIIGFTVIAGWIFDIKILKSVIDGYPPMKFNTAVCFILAGVALYLVQNKNVAAAFVSRLSSPIIFLIAIISLSENLFHFSSGLDNLFFDDPDLSATNSGSMATATSFCFMLISISFFTIKVESDKLRLVAQCLLHFVSAIATIVIIGYLYNVPAFYKLFLLSSVALHTGVMLFLLSVVASFINSDKGITGLFTGKEIGNQMARDIFPFLLVLILGTGFLRLQYFRTHTAAIEFGIAIVTTSFILFSLLIIGLTAKQLNRINRRRLEAEESLRAMDLAVQKINEQRKFQEQLAKEEERKKKEIMDAIINAQERERYEISHELHDNVSQVLTTCKLLMESAHREHDSKFTRLSLTHLQLAIDEIRNLSHQLNPDTLKHIGLEGSINDLIDAVNKTRKIRIEFKFEVAQIEKLKSEVQLALFRIIQEQVNNILKHSDAKTAFVALSVEDDHIKLIIKDDGKGHDFTSQKHGLGLRNIFNRAEFHKGEAKIFSEPNKGFELLIRIPAKSLVTSD